MTLCKKQWKSWRCVWRPNGYISKRNLVSEVTSMIIDQGQQQQCLGPMTQRPSSSWNSHINGGASLCSAWSWHSSSSMVVRIVGGPTFHGVSGGYLGEQPGAKDLLARSGGFCLSNWRDSEVRRRTESNSGGSSKFLTVVISLQSIWKLIYLHFHHFHFFYVMVASRMIFTILDLFTEEDALASKTCFKIYQSCGSSQQKTIPVKNYLFKCTTYDI